MIRTRPARRPRAASPLALAALLLLLLPAAAPGAELVETARGAGGGSGALARNAAAKLLEKAGEYGYDDIDVLARFGTGLKYPDGIEVRRLDATLALLDLALVATERGAGYASFLFQNPLGRLVFQTIPYATGRDSIPDVLLRQLKGALREAFERDPLARRPPGEAAQAGSPGGPALLGLDIPIPKIAADPAAARRDLRLLQRGARHLSGPLSAELAAAVAAHFPGITVVLSERLMEDLATGRFLVSILEVLRAYDRQFAAVNALIARGARLVEFADAARETCGEHGPRLLTGIPASLAELDELCALLSREKDLAGEIARFGREYWTLARELPPGLFARLRPLGERALRVRERHGAEGLAFVAAFPGDGERFLAAMRRPSSFIKRRVAMASFAARHGLPALRAFPRLGLLPAWEPFLYLLALLLSLLLAARLLASGGFLVREVAAMPARRKFALVLVAALALCAFWFTLVENARLFLEEDPRAGRPFARTPAIPREASTWFSTHLPALDSVETRFAAMLAEGERFRTAEVDLFRRDVADLRSKYVAVMESFEVRLVGEPRLFENYSSDRILTERDFLIEITVGARNLGDAPRLFPLTVELSTVLGEVLSPVEGGARLAKTTFNPGVTDTFPLTFPFRPEDRPDRIVVRREHLVGASEAFLDFGPGTPLRVGDLFAARFGLLFPERFELRATGEAALRCKLLSSADGTREIDLLARTGLDAGIFLVARDGRTFALGTVESPLPGLPAVPQNAVVPLSFVFPVDPALSAADLPHFVVNKKKALTESYQRIDEIGRTVDTYLRRLAAAAEFEMGMYYYDPPLYRKWARDLDTARHHFGRAHELLPECEPIRQAVRLTRP